jgi:hypothetical protein
MLGPAVPIVLLLCNLPGRSELGLVVANPFGNLMTISIDLQRRREKKTDGYGGSAGYA